MDWREKIKALRRMSEEDPADPLTFFMLGSEELRAGQFPEAAHSLSRCLELNPRHTAAIRLLGDAYRGMGETGKARATYERAIAAAEQTGDLQVAKEARAWLKRLS
jgi:uncharacterized protein HemY